MPDYSGKPLVEVKNLVKYFDIPGKGKLHAVDDLSFQIYPGETLGLVGESGCGKSTVGNTIMKLHPKTSGEILLDGKDVYSAEVDKNEFCRKVQMIFQDPYSSLNPRKTIYDILSEPLQIQKIVQKGSDRDAFIGRLCDTVGLSRDLLNHYPHELDGGMRQVVGIARALALDPCFIVCDEPVSALDVSVQAKIINLLMDLQKERNLAYLFISHDLSVVRHISDRIAVMYLGQIVEMADTETIFTNAMHPYTIALMSAIPKINPEVKGKRIVLKGDVPSPVNPKPGCRFAPRCWMSCQESQSIEAEWKEVEEGHWVRCPHFRDTRIKAETAETVSM